MTEDTRTPLIQVRHLTFQYPTAPTPAVQDVSFTLYPGDRVLVIGHNGSGKSTLLSLLGGRRKPQGKSAQGHGTKPHQPSKEAAAPVERSVAVLGGNPFDDTNMAQHIALIGPPWPPEAYFANTVDCVASPAPVLERKTAIAEALHLRLSRAVDRMSAGEKRRVQILHGMLHPATVYLLDECSTDIDVAERKTVLELVRSECESRQGCCLYATHILDRIHDWATHVLLMKAGRVVAFHTVEELHVLMQLSTSANANDTDALRQLSLEQFALRFMAEGNHYGGRKEETLQALALPVRFDLDQLTATGSNYTNDDRKMEENDSLPVPAGHNYFATEVDRLQPLQCKEEVIVCKDLSFRDVFTRMSFTVYRGERVLLCGCNGAGKTTLLNMLGGKQFFKNDTAALSVLGKVCYDDMTLNGQVAYGGDWWVRVPGGEMHVREMLSITNARAARLRELLAVDLDWDVRHISCGEQKRVQILLYLLEDKPIVLLDEATADLDVDQRHALLSFLFAESVTRGVTVVYSTHIFGGLEGWASTALLLDRMARGVHAVWRLRDGESVHLDRVTAELIDLKAKEEF